MTARRAARALAGGASALAFLTVVPLGRRVPRSGRLGPAAAWFPLVGGAAGLAAGGVRAGVDPLVGALPATVLAVIAGVVLTGGLHQDGLADFADALGARGGADRRQRRLEVMRDPTVGTFGVLALVAWALLVVTGVGSMATERAVIALVVAGALGRLAAVGHARACPPARPDGLSAGFAPSRVGAALAAASVAPVLVLAGPVAGASALAAAAAVCAGSVALSGRRFGGRTGDTLGATICATEVAVVLALLAAWRS